MLFAPVKRQAELGINMVMPCETSTATPVLLSVVTDACRD